MGHEGGLAAVDTMLQEVVEQLQGQPRPASVEFRAEVPDDVMPLEAEGALLRQVLITVPAGRSGDAQHARRHGLALPISKSILRRARFCAVGGERRWKRLNVLDRRVQRRPNSRRGRITSIVAHTVIHLCRQLLHKSHQGTAEPAVHAL